MIKRICDRCKSEIKGNYWLIDIYEKEDNTGRVTTEGAINNLKQNTDKMLSRQKEYCNKCINEIKDTIKGGTNES